MPVDDRTTNRAYQMPSSGNFLGEDVVRLRTALQAIDADIFARYTKGETDALINGIVNGAPGALNTLQELAAALGGDANFSATVINLLSLKANSADVYSKTAADARFVQGQTQAEMVFVATAGQAAFGLSTAVTNKPSALVTVDGVVQPTSQYSLNQEGTVLTLTEGVPLGTIVRVLVMGVASANAPGDDTVTTQKLRDEAVTAAKLAAAAVATVHIQAGAVTPSKLERPKTLMQMNAGGTAPFPSSGGPQVVDFTGIPSWASRVVVMLLGASTNGNAGLRIHLGSGGTLETANYNSASTSMKAGIDTILSVNGFDFNDDINANGGATTLRHGSITLSHMGSNIWVANGQVAYSQDNRIVTICGSINLPGALDVVRITTTNGNDRFDGGRINVSYE